MAKARGGCSLPGSLPSSAIWMFSRTHCSLLVLGLYRAPKGHRLTSYSFRSVFAAWKPHKEVRPNPNITNNRTFQCFLLGTGLFRGSAGGGAVGRPFPACEDRTGGRDSNSVWNNNNNKKAISVVVLQGCSSGQEEKCPRWRLFS